jgi:hypothetical protein
MNEKEELEKRIAERFVNLQPEIQAVIMSPEYEKSLMRIIEKYKLNQSQIEIFETETSLVLIGHTHPDEYRIELKKLQLSKEVRNQIVNDVFDSILAPIVDMLRDNFDKDDMEEIKYGEFANKIAPKTSTNMETNLRADLKNVPKVQDNFLNGLADVINKSIEK